MTHPYKGRKMYNQDKDKLIKMFEMKDTKGSSLLISIFSYDNGPKKLSMTRTYEKKDNTVGYANAGRLTLEEVNFLKNKLDDIIKEMESS